MAALESLRQIYLASRFFGISPYKMEWSHGKYIFSENKILLLYSVLLIGLIHPVISAYTVYYFYILIAKIEELWYSWILTLNVIIFTVNFHLTPIISLRYRTDACIQLNRIGEMQRFFEQLNRSTVNLMKLKVIHSIFLAISISTVLIMASMSIISDFFIYPDLLYREAIFSIFQIPISLTLSISLLQYFAFLNIVRSFYGEINKFLSVKPVKNLDILKFLREADMNLKDFLDVISKRFSVTLITYIFQAFVSALDALLMFLYFNATLNLALASYIVFIITYSLFLTTTICTMTSAEVSIVFF